MTKQMEFVMSDKTGRSDADVALELLATVYHHAARSQTFIQHFWNAAAMRPLMVRDDHLAELARIPHITILSGFSDFQSAVRRENGVLLEDLRIFLEKAREGIRSTACVRSQPGREALMALRAKDT